jgi:hypothetical protein
MIVDWAIFKRDCSDWPAVLRYVDSVAFRVPDPAFRNRAEYVGLSRGLRDFHDRVDTLHLKTEMVDSPRKPCRADQSEIDKAI